MDNKHDTIFTKIIRKEIPAKIVFEDNTTIAFHDINPKAKVHVLIVPKKPIATVDDCGEEDEKILGHLFVVARKVAAELGLTKGYRLVVNCKHEGGQEVYHLHVHLLGGQQMGALVA